MKIRSERDKRTYLIIALCAILVVMGVGYAAFSSLLTINGTANISNSWCLGFDNTMTSTMEITKGVSTGTQPTGSMTYSGTACGSTLQPNSSLNAHFYQPGDEIEYTLTITNKSTVTAAIKSILVDNESVTSNTTKKKGNITYVVEMPVKTTLAVNESTTMKVIAKFQNEEDVTGNVNGETKTIEVKINAEQDDGNGGFTPTPVSNKFTGTLYRWNTSVAKNGGSILAESGTKYVITNGNQDVEFYDTQSECETALVGYGSPAGFSCQQKTVTTGVGEYTTDASTLNKTYYLKHDVVDDIITASYVCFVTDTEHCMQGVDPSFYSVNVGVLQTQESWFNSQGGSCSLNSSGSSSVCDGGGFVRVVAYSVGDAYAYVGSGYCGVVRDGRSVCGEYEVQNTGPDAH